MVGGRAPDKLVNCRIPGYDRTKGDTMSDPLEELLAECPTHVGSLGIQKVNYTHDAMIDMIIANPAISQNALAVQFGYTASWVSQIMASDAFQSRMAERTAEVVDPTLRATVKDRFEGLLLRSLSLLQEKLNAPATMVSDNLVLRTAEMAAKANGYGARIEQNTQVNMNLHLDSLGDNLVQLLRKKQSEVLDG